MSTLLFGGSFDPFHVGHLAIIQTLREHFPELTSIEILPNAQSPGKIHHTEAIHRQAMLEAVVSTYFPEGTLPPVHLNLFELSQAQTSYTVDTVLHFAQLGPVSFVIGWDQWVQFDRWKSPRLILETLDRLLVVNRPIGEPTSPALLQDFSDKIGFVDMPACAVSSAEIRGRVLGGKTLAGFVPDCVANYIATHRLYRKRPFVLGVTGRVGSGKSYAVSCLASHFKAFVIDLDGVGHKVLEDPVVQAQLMAAFGRSDRARLSQLVFESPEALARLNQIVHPVLKQRVLDQLSESGDVIVIIVGALIHELALAPSCDHILTIDAEDPKILASVGDKFTRISRFQRSRGAYLAAGDSHLLNDFSPQFCDHLIAAVQTVFMVH